MQSILNPYIHFKGNAKEAMEFYKSVFGGNLVLNTFQQGGMAPTEADNDKIMHSQLTTEKGMTIMGSDTPDKWEYKPVAGISISLSGDDDAELRGFWEKLSEGGKIAQPSEKAPWGDSFGMLTDKYSIEWMVNIAGKK